MPIRERTFLLVLILVKLEEKMIGMKEIFAMDRISSVEMDRVPVTDKEYNVLKFKGKAMWGARLFEEAEDASGRRANRTNRRRLARRHQRLLLLEMLFADAVCKQDPNFFRRLEESGRTAGEGAGISAEPGRGQTGGDQGQ